MTCSPGRPQIIWATRGRSWGFRFLLDGGFPDPLPHYENAFASVGDDPTTWARSDTAVALRLSDPLGRRDESGRPIPHEFVLFGDLADQIESVDDGLRLVWPLVESTYARVWANDNPPVPSDLT